MTINSLPTGKSIYLGIIGNLDAGRHSYNDSTSYGWMDNSLVWKGGSKESGASGWTKFVKGECLYFHLKENKLTMFSVQKKQTFAIDIDIDVATTFDAYIHFNFIGTGTKLTLEPLDQADYQAATMISSSNFVTQS